MPVGHIHKHAFAGLVDAQFLALFVDGGDHQLGMLDRIGFRVPLAAVRFFDIFGQVVVEQRRTGRGNVQAEGHIHPR